MVGSRRLDATTSAKLRFSYYSDRLYRPNYRKMPNPHPSINQYGSSRYETRHKQSTQRPEHRAQQAGRPNQPNRKRNRGAENEELTEHTHKSPRLLENSNRRRRNAENKFQPQTPRKSPRLHEIRDLNQRRVKQEGKRTRSPPRTIGTHYCIGQRRPQTERRILKTPKSQNIPILRSRSPVDESPVSKRKRHRGQDDVVKPKAKRQKPSGNQAQPSRAVDTDASTLTSKHLKHLDRQIQSQYPSTEKSVLRQWEFVNMPRSRKTGTQSRQTEDTSSSTKTVSTSDTRFPKIAVDNGILVPRDSTQPSNFDEFYNYLNRSRESASPELDEYEQYLCDADTADNEETVKQAVLGLLKKYSDRSYRTAYNQQLTEYPPNVGFNDNLSAPTPDLVQGINLQAFKPYPVEERLGGSAVPTANKYSITLAHLAGEFKRPGGNLIQARSQVAYDAASFVYSRNKALETMGRADPPGTARIGSFISDGTHIITFAHHATSAPGEMAYHQKPVTDTNIQISFESFKTGRKQLRNLQDLTRETSYLLRKELLDHYELSQSQSNQQLILERNGCPEYGNGYSNAGSSVGVGSEPYVLVDRPTPPESLSILEAEAIHVTSQSSDSARSQHNDHLAPHIDVLKKIPKQRNTRSSARLLERRSQVDRS